MMTYITIVVLSIDMEKQLLTWKKGAYIPPGMRQNPFSCKYAWFQWTSAVLRALSKHTWLNESNYNLYTNDSGRFLWLRVAIVLIPALSHAPFPRNIRFQKRMFPCRREKEAEFDYPSKHSESRRPPFSPRLILRHPSRMSIGASLLGTNVQESIRPLGLCRLACKLSFTFPLQL